MSKASEAIESMRLVMEGKEIKSKDVDSAFKALKKLAPNKPIDDDLEDAMFGGARPPSPDLRITQKNVSPVHVFIYQGKTIVEYVEQDQIFVYTGKVSLDKIIKAVG